MLEKSSVHHRAAGACGLLFAWALAGCLAPEPSSSSSTSPNDSGSTGSDATNEMRSDDSGTVTATGDAGGPADASPGSNATPSPDAAPTPITAPTPNDAGAHGDAGIRDIGSCCSAQTTPGCGDPNLELCVCAKDSTCCTKAWTLGCALIVQQKYCQPNVRACVCGADAGQWGQTQCCDTDWNSTCDSVATLKCSATQGCF